MRQLSRRWRRLREPGAERKLRSSCERLLIDGFARRRDFERDLDGAQQELSVLSMKLRMLEATLSREHSDAHGLASQARKDLSRTSEWLRDLAHRIYPAVLKSDGLQAALEAAAERAPAEVRVECERLGRHSPELEAVVYFSCTEILENSGSPRAAERASIAVAETPRTLRFEVRAAYGDRPPAAEAIGTQTAADSVRALGGEFTVEPGLTGERIVTGSIPL